LSSSWFLLEWGGLPGRERFDPLEVPEKCAGKNVLKLVALVGLRQKTHQKLDSPLPGTLLWLRIEPMPFEKLERIAPRNVTKFTHNHSESKSCSDLELLSVLGETLWRHSDAHTPRNVKRTQELLRQR
jgi:hypothetical protein